MLNRIVELLKGGKIVSIPFMPITMMAASDFVGERYKDYATDYRIQALGQLEITDYYNIDHVSAISDPVVEAHDYGAPIIFFENDPPMADGKNVLLHSRQALVNFKPVLPENGKRMSNRLRLVEELKTKARGRKLVEGWVEGPCAEAADLRGLNSLMMDFYDDPSFVTDIFEIVTQGGINFARAQIAAGAELIGVGDAAASLLGPDLYNEYVWEYEKKIVDAIHQAGAYARLHICGDTRRILGSIGRLGYDIVDLDYLAPFDNARKEMGESQILCGNIDPVSVVKNGTPETVRQALDKCRGQAGPNYICGAGCEIPRGTPKENFRAMSDFADSGV